MTLLFGETRVESSCHEVIGSVPRCDYLKLSLLAFAGDPLFFFSSSTGKLFVRVRHKQSVFMLNMSVSLMGLSMKEVRLLRQDALSQYQQWSEQELKAAVRRNFFNSFPA